MATFTPCKVKLYFPIRIFLPKLFPKMVFSLYRSPDGRMSGPIQYDPLRLRVADYCSYTGEFTLMY